MTFQEFDAHCEVLAEILEVQELVSRARWVLLNLVAEGWMPEPTEIGIGDGTLRE